MLARDLAVAFPTVRLDTPAMEAARLLAERNLPGLIVVDERGRPLAILPDTLVLRMAVPRYYLDDPALVEVVPEPDVVDVFLHTLNGRTVSECLLGERREPPVVQPDATMLEIAAMMAGVRSPLVAVVGGQDGMLGAVTLDALMDWLVAQ